MNKQKLATSTNRFGFDLLKALFDEGGRDKTVFISPLSVSVCFSMALNGAKGATRKAIARALGVPVNQLKKVNEAIRSLMEELESADPNAKVEIANAMFAKVGYEFKQQFINTNTNLLRAEVQNLDFEGNPDGALATINGWCAEKTHGKIKSILEQIPGEAVLFLLNAVYFKGMWTTPFQKGETKPRQFTRLDGSVIKPKTMKRSGGFRYTENDDFQAVALLYGEGRFSMYVFRPQDDKSVLDLVDSLDNEKWDAWRNQLQRRRRGTVYLPKFKLDYFAKLNDVLKGMGMEIAFDPDNADFSNMVPPPEQVCIDEVRHKTFIEVNEEFTEAAAVTSIGMVRSTSVIVEPPPFELKVDKPFLCAIVDEESGALLFLGAIVSPE